MRAVRRRGALCLLSTLPPRAMLSAAESAGNRHEGPGAASSDTAWPGVAAPGRTPSAVRWYTQGLLVAGGLRRAWARRGGRRGQRRRVCGGALHNKKRVGVGAGQGGEGAGSAPSSCMSQMLSVQNRLHADAPSAPPSSPKGVLGPSAGPEDAAPMANTATPPAGVSRGAQGARGAAGEAGLQGATVPPLGWGGGGTRHVPCPPLTFSSLPCQQATVSDLLAHPVCRLTAQKERSTNCRLARDRYGHHDGHGPVRATSKSMLAARLKEGGAVEVETVPIPEPKVGEARLKIIQGGICNTDVELTRGFVCVCALRRRGASRCRG